MAGPIPKVIHINVMKLIIMERGKTITPGNMVGAGHRALTCMSCFLNSYYYLGEGFFGCWLVIKETEKMVLKKGRETIQFRCHYGRFLSVNVEVNIRV